jgi:hypothetical protein
LKTVSFKANDNVAREISVIAIVRAMVRYDRILRKNDDDSGRLYAVRHKGRLYPPKRLLALATGVKVTRFSGGEGKRSANRVFRELGFEIIFLDADRIPHGAHDPKKINAPVPSISKLLRNLFSQRWTNLHTNLGKLCESQYPGVYLIAYTKTDLEGKRVNPSEVFYVGMSHAGLIKRLQQFIAGLEDGSHHSGSKRFFCEYACRVAYKFLKRKKTFYVAALALPCVVNKEQRTSLDLKKMGEVARLEYYALSWIKETTRLEPLLNRK